MLNLSITACSFSLKKSNTIGNKSVFYLNKPIKMRVSGEQIIYNNSFEFFSNFFKANNTIIDDEENKRAFKCTYNNEKYETDDFIIYPVLINSGTYGSTSDIINIKTKNIQYKKKNTDVDFKQFYFFIVFPKDNLDVSIQKGMFIFQNIGPYGIKTLITEKLQEFLSDIYSITLNCKTISPELFVKKVLNEKSIKQITMIKNYKSSDSLDNYNLGYGQEIKTLAKLNFKEPMWEKIKSSMLYVSGAKNRVFEFEDIKYDAVKVLVEIGGRMRKISLNNIENLSIIESIPDDIKTISGNPDKEKLIEYLKEVIKEYLEEMVLNFE